MEEGMSRRATSGDTHVAAVWGHTAYPTDPDKVPDKSLGQELPTRVWDKP